MNIENLLWLIPLPPLLAFFIIILLTNRSNWLSHALAIFSVILSWAGGMYVFWQVIQMEHLGEHPIESTIKWFATGDTYFEIGVLIDPLGAMSLFFVIWTVLMIFIYSVGYHNFGQPKGDHDRPGLPPHGATVEDMHGHKHTVFSIEPMYARFFAFISLFAFGMLLLVLSNNLLTLFMGWEIMGLCSYLLIGFWYGKPSARAAMIKAFLTTRVGDVFMLLGIAYLYSATGTLTYSDIFQPQVLEELVNTPALFGLFGWSAAALIGVLLFIGTIGKSAQWPLHVWLPDAMEGPTPVSAMIHAAAMVSAGVYMVIRVFPLLSAGWHHGGSLTPPMLFMAFIGTFTAIFAATIAVAQNDIKRVLAYSTISQLGFMIAALGIGAYVAAAFHLFTHAFFKALLFMGSGSVIHGMEFGVFHTKSHIDPQDMLNMGGLRKKMPVTFWTFLIGGFALSGFPLLTAGFWSKDEILADAFYNGYYLVLGVLAIAAFLTAFYTMRQITLTFLGKPRTNAAEHAHETKWTMTLPLVILAVFAVAVGWFGIHEEFPLLGGLLPNWFHEFVGHTLLEPPEKIPFNAIPLLISVVVALGGLLSGWLVYRHYQAGEVDPLQKALGPVYRVLKNKYYFDELYELIFIRPVTWLSDEFANWVDRVVIDGILHAVAYLSGALGSFLRKYIDVPVVNGVGDWVAESTKKFGFNLRPIQTGKIQQYMVYGLTTAAIFAAVYFWLVSTR